MKLAIATRAFPESMSLADAALRARELGVDRLSFDMPGPVAPGSREDLKGVGVEVAALSMREGALGGRATDVFEAALLAALRLGGAWKARALVVEAVGGFADARADREEAVEAVARRLHGPLKEGVPFVIRHGTRPDDLLLAEETEWLLDALPRLGLLLDPTGALRLAAGEKGPLPDAWAERFAHRVVLASAHGAGADRQGGAHPADGGSDWKALVGLLPGGVTWIVETSPRVADLADVVRYLQDRLLGG